MLPFTFIVKILITFPLNLLRFVCPTREPSIGRGARGGIHQCQRRRTGVRLHNIPNCVREIALHGVRHGAAMALASVQAHSGHELRFLPHGFLVVAHPGDHERLIEDFFSAANSVAFIS